MAVIPTKKIPEVEKDASLVVHPHKRFVGNYTHSVEGVMSQDCQPILPSER